MSQRSEFIIALRKEGFKTQRIAELLGVHVVTVCRLSNPKHYELERTTRRAVQRRANGQRAYTCRICGQKGHNARRHQNYSAEDVQRLGQDYAEARNVTASNAKKS